MNLTESISRVHLRLELLLDQYITKNTFFAPELQKAMAYSTLNGGKRTRPILVYLTGRMLDTPWEDLDAPAAAIELIHVYSLIHDDLPAMDNADLRRGKPSCHKAFNEATAILAGDALQPLAFEIIARHASALTCQQRLEMIKILSDASGFRGMAAGQMLDMEGVNTPESLIEMYRLKTGALLKAAVQLGAISANTSDPAIINALDIFAENMGLAFQIQDDLLDIEGSTETIGKPQGADQVNSKVTFPSLLGIQESRQKIETLFNTAIHALDIFGEKKSMLAEFAGLLMQRNK